MQLINRFFSGFPLGNSLLKWFTSFFDNRRQAVRVGSSISNQLEIGIIFSGVRLRVRPIMFRIFFDDLSFVDDEKKYFKQSNIREILNYFKS